MKNQRNSWCDLKIRDRERTSGRKIGIAAVSNSISAPDRAHFTVPFTSHIRARQIRPFRSYSSFVSLATRYSKHSRDCSATSPRDTDSRPFKPPSTQRGIHLFRANTPSTASIFFFSSCSSRPSRRSGGMAVVLP